MHNSGVQRASQITLRVPDEIDYQKIRGVKIRLSRILAGLSQDDLANKLSVDRSMVSRYESGLTDPNASLLSAIAKAVNQDFSFFE